MKIYKIDLESSLDIANLNLAIGNFDGIHIGHQFIIKRLINLSNEMHAIPTIMTFSPHPRQFFSVELDNFNIISNNLKTRLLKKLGVKYLIILDFNKTIASLSPEEFIKIILVRKLKIKNLVVGYDFKFGKDRKGNVELLKNQSLIHNFTVNVIEQVKLKETSEIYSSSVIRKYIQEGNFEKVKLCLGRNWSMDGVVVTGKKRASKMNFPTANIIPPNLIYPKKGVYVVRTLYEGTFLEGIANFGIRPTIDGKKLLLEVHLFNFKSNLYGKDLTVEFLAFIRDEQKFENINKLKQQIHNDIQIAKNYHSKN